MFPLNPWKNQWVIPSDLQKSSDFVYISFTFFIQPMQNISRVIDPQSAKVWVEIWSFFFFLIRLLVQDFNCMSTKEIHMTSPELREK